MDEQNRDLLEERQAPPASEEASPEAAPDAQSATGVDPERYAAPEIDADDEDDAPTEWVPSRFEKRIHAIPEKRWKLYQMLGGAAIGVYTVIALFYGGNGLNPMLLVALVLALLVPNMLEDRGRRKLTRGRVTIAIVMAVGIAVMAIYTGVTKGWRLFSKQEEAEAALRLMQVFRV